MSSTTDFNEEEIENITEMLNRYSKGEATPLDILYLVNYVGIEDLGLEKYVPKEKEKFCDMHNHSSLSDGFLTPIEILYLSKLLGLNRVAISDHDCIDAYLDQEFIQTAKDLNIEIIPAVELVSAYKDVGIEILAYGVNVDKMKKYLDKNGVNQNKLDRYRSKKIPEVFARHGINLNYNPSTVDFTQNNAHVLRTLFDIVKNDPKAVEFLNEENPHLLNSTNSFLRSGLNNPNSKIFIEPNSIYPQYDKITNLIHDLDGIAILAHPYEYKDQMQRILNGVKNHVDGIECYHPSSLTPERNQFLLDFCNKNNLLVSGGSDSHNLDPTSAKGMFNGLKVPAKYFDIIKEAINEKQNSKENI